jgi:hypothetical protein
MKYNNKSTMDVNCMEHNHHKWKKTNLQMLNSRNSLPSGQPILRDGKTASATRPSEHSRTWLSSMRNTKR